MTRYAKRIAWLVTMGSLLVALCVLGAGWQGVKRIGLVSPLGYEAKLTAGGALQLTTDAPGTPPEVNPPGSSYDRLAFIYSQLPNTGLQINADGKIHVTIDGLTGGTNTWGAITGTLSAQTDLQAALDAKEASLGFTAENVANKSTTTTLGTSDTLYPSQKAVKTYVDTVAATKEGTLADAAADGTTKGKAAFVAADFNATAGVIALDYTNAQKATGSLPGFLSSADWTTFNAKQAAVTAGAGLGLSGVTLSTASTEAGFLTDGAAVDLTCGAAAQGKMQVMDAGTLQYCDGAATSALQTLTPGTAAADGTTKGTSTFTAADFNASAGVISLDYTNAQKASTSLPGFLSATDWNTFNDKQATVTAGAGLTFSGATMRTLSTEAGFLTDGAASDLTCDVGNQGKMQVMDSGEFQYCDGATTSVLHAGIPTQTGLTWNVTAGTCTGDGNSGKLTVNVTNEIVCASDIGGAGGGADVTAVGNCLTGDCFTAGVPGLNLTMTNATSGTITLQAVTGALGTKTISFPAVTGTVCTTGSVCSGYAPSTQAAADGATLGIAAFTAADFNAAAGVISLDYTNAQKATGSVPGFLTSADWTTFNAKVSLTGTETLTNKRITQKVTTVASSTSLACSADASDVCSQQNTGASGTLTLSAPTGTPTPMQKLLYRIKCTNAQTYAFNATFRFSTTVTQPVTCAAGKTDYIGVIYNDLEPKWDVVAVDQGH